jgi:imidazolonepropionase
MLITNIKQLVGIHKSNSFLKGAEMQNLPLISNAYLRIEGEEIVAFGPMSELKTKDQKTKDPKTLDAKGGFVLPAWCDSHTHIVYAGSREAEFVSKIKGMSYEEIARNGGGILNSARLLNETSEDELYKQAKKRLEGVIKTGTGAIEIKSGYGLTLEGEIKMLRVIKKLKKKSKVQIKATFLGAHTFPLNYKYKHEDYIKLIIEEMLPIIHKEQLADYIDVFCEQGFFSVAETAQILEAGIKYGLKPKIHANQLHRSGGVQVGVKYNAISVDHLETMGEEEIEYLKKSNTIPTLLPSAAFFLRMPYQPARTMIDAGLGVAIATDYNPGSSPSGNMSLLVAMSCIQMRMTPEEAINAATINGACAMELQDKLGSIAIGKKANLIITKPMPSLAYFPYSFGENLIKKVVIKGEIAF